MCVICTDVVWLLLYYHRQSSRVPHANEAICKLTSWNVHNIILLLLLLLPRVTYNQVQPFRIHHLANQF